MADKPIHTYSSREDSISVYPLAPPVPGQQIRNNQILHGDQITMCLRIVRLASFYFLNNSVKSNDFNDFWFTKFWRNL